MKPARSEDTPRDSVTLVARIQAGERQAEDELVERYSRGVSIIIRRAASDPAAVDDIHQETFRIALQKIRKGDIQEPAKLSGFICSLARNLVIDHFRRASRFGGEDLESVEPLKDPRPSQLDQLLEEEKLKIVRKVLADLASDRDQQMLYRFYIAEEDKDRICRDLGLTSLHFNRVLFRARERYKELYQEAVRRM